MRILLAFALAGLISDGASAPKPAAPRKADDPIAVTSKGGAEPDHEKNLMVYTDQVHFSHPAQGLKISCDRLEVHPNPIPNGNKLSNAVATGNVVVRKAGANGKISIAKGEKAVFDTKTNSTTLSGKPQPELEVGDFLFYADTITLQQNGQHRLGENARTVFKKPKNVPDGR